MKLTYKRALVTGATSGLGAAIARRFASEGASLLITGRRADRLRALEAELREAGHQAHAITADHTAPSENARVVEAAVAALGGLDVLVNNAGAIGNDRIADEDAATWRKLMDVNVEAVHDLTRRVVPHLGEGASIVNMSSVAGLRPYPGLLAYCVSKAAVEMFTKVLALELAPRGIRVNSINPGVVETELHRTAGMNEAEYASFLERCQQTHPLGRVGQPHEVAALTTFLASDEAGWITGASHSIDGGRALTSLR